MAEFHLLRPFWLLALFPLIGFILLFWRLRPSSLPAFEAICDPHLLVYLEQKKGLRKSLHGFLLLFFSLFFMIIALSGPSWYRLPVHTYKTIKPRVLILDLSDEMMQTDLSPNRLARAKFKLQDLLSRKDLGQFGLVVFTGEPFVVSPLTDDGQTIAALLPSLTPEVMPISGYRLDTALQEASHLFKTAGFQQGQILVLSAHTPSLEAIQEATALARAGIYSSILPMIKDLEKNPLFERFAKAGKGQLLQYSSDSSDLDRWLNHSMDKHYALNQEDDIPLWRDEGRWFLIPAMILLLPIFRRHSTLRGRV